MTRTSINKIPKPLSAAFKRWRRTMAGFVSLLALAAGLAGFAYWLLANGSTGEAAHRTSDLGMVIVACLCALIGVLAWIAVYMAVRSADVGQPRLSSNEEVSGRIVELPNAAQSNSQTMSTQAMGDYLANVSHDIRTSMNCVLGMTNILLQTNMTAMQREYVTVMRTSCESMLLLVGSILELSSTEAGRIVLDSVTYSVRERTADVVQLFTPEASKKGLRIETHIAGDVPAEVRGDPLRLRQILANLLSNAIKFSEQGTIQVICRKIAGAQESNGQIRLEFAVVDNGVGIPAEYQSRIFERFGQGESAIDGNITGTGLGLSISRELAVLMGGGIGVVSWPDSGSRFWFTILVDEKETVPTAADLNRESSLAATPEPFVPNAMPHQNSKLLVVDDNEGNLLVAKRMCEELGYRVKTAANGEAALAAHATDTYSAILIDCQMPGLSGDEVTDVIRKRESIGVYTPIIAVTANVLPADRHKALSAGVDGYLSKPIFIEALAATLKDVFERVSPDEARRSIMEVPIEAAESQADIFDMSTVGELLSVPGSSGRNLFRELVDQFVQLTPRSVDELDKAAKSRDMDEIRRLAHYLLGMCRQLGAQRLAETCASLERLENDAPKELIAWYVEKIRAEFRAANDALDGRHNYRCGPDKFEALTGN